MNTENQISDALETNIRLFAREVLHFNYITPTTTVEFIDSALPNNDYSILRLGNNCIKIANKQKKRFIAVMLEKDYLVMKDLAKHIFDKEDKNFIYGPYINSEKIFNVIPMNDSFYSLETGIFFKIDDKLEKLITAITETCKHLAELFTKGAIEFSKDGTKFKEGDYHIGFSTEKTGFETEFFICLDIQPPVSKDNVGEVKLERKPITDKMMEELFDYIDYSIHYDGKGDAKITHAKLAYEKRTGPRNPLNIPEEDYITDRVTKSMDYMNNLIKVFIHSSRQLSEDEYVQNYIKNKINSIIIGSICSIALKPYAIFGGQDNFDVVNNESPSYNAIQVSQVVDKEIIRITKLIESIPAQEGIDYFTMDVDNFGIYGVNSEGERVVTVTDERFIYGLQIQPEYSNGMHHFIKNYIPTIKNKMFSKTVGNVK